MIEAQWQCYCRRELSYLIISRSHKLHRPHDTKKSLPLIAGEVGLPGRRGVRQGCHSWVAKGGDEVAVRACRGVQALYHPAVCERCFAVLRAERLAPAVAAHEAEGGSVAEVAGLLVAWLALWLPHGRRLLGVGGVLRSGGYSTQLRCTIPKPTNRTAWLYLNMGSTRPMGQERSSPQILYCPGA